MEKSEYFTEDSIVKDELYKSISSLIICPLCNKIYEEPMVCNNCNKVYCNKCLEERGNICPNGCQDSQLLKCVTKNELLSQLKYKCKNCCEEITRNNLNSHLESNCTHKMERKLSEILQTKKTLKKLQHYDKDQNLPSFTSKINNINFFLY